MGKKELPFLKFNPLKWLSGKISFQSLEIQGAFIQVMCVCWEKGGSFNEGDVDYRISQVGLQKLLDLGFVYQNENGGYSIEFLDELISEYNELSAIRKAAGSQGGRSKRKQTEANGSKKSNKKKNKKEEEEEEKIKNKKEEKEEEEEEEVFNHSEQFPLNNSNESSDEFDPDLNDHYYQLLRTQGIWFEALAKNRKLSIDSAEKLLSEFIEEQNLSGNLSGRSENDLKSHFNNWTRKRIGSGSNNGNLTAQNSFDNF